MNKIYICAVVSAVSVSIGIAAAAAAVSNVSIKTGTKNLSYTYVIDGDGVSEKSVKALFNDFNDISENKLVERFEVSSSTDERDPIYLRLKLKLDEVPEGLEYSPVDYFSFTIKDADGEVLYSTENEGLSDSNASEKEIPLGVFNTSYAEDIRILNIEYGLNNEIGAYIDDSYIDDMDIMLVSSLYKDGDGSSMSVQPIVTLKPQFPIETAAPQETDETASSTPEAAETAQPAETAVPEETEKPKEKKVICGEDIEPGRYVVTGNANVKITTADGDIISETTVTDVEDESIKGVKQFITSIENGDVITITPISDDIKAVVSFDRTNSGTKSSTAASSVSGTSSTSKPSATSSSKTTSKTNTAGTSSEKSNPKTGDDGLATISLVSIMGVSAISVGALEVIKRKKTVK